MCDAHRLHSWGRDDGGGTAKSGTGTLLADGTKVAEGKIERTVARRFSLDETFDVGEDTGTLVVEGSADKMPFRFTGKLKRPVIELKGLRAPIFWAGSHSRLGTLIHPVPADPRSRRQRR
jgi:hypothetical protein